MTSSSVLGGTAIPGPEKRMALKTVLITGANRGIGLGLVREFIKMLPSANLIVTTRKAPESGSELGKIIAANPNVRRLQLDVTEFDGFEAFARKVDDIVGESGLQLVVNNAGVLPRNRDLESVTPDDMLEAYKVNCVGPLFLSKALLPLMRKAVRGAGENPAELGPEKAALVMVSTAVASIAENEGGSSYAYRCSKVGLNMAMKNLSLDLGKEGILVMSMHPGWVLTDMGGPNALIDVDTCVSNMVKTIMQLSEKDHGKFLRYNNTPIQW